VWGAEEKGDGIFFIAKSRDARKSEMERASISFKVLGLILSSLPCSAVAAALS
jgi:hypothetical protein